MGEREEGLSKNESKRQACEKFIYVALVMVKPQ